MNSKFLRESDGNINDILSKLKEEEKKNYQRILTINKEKEIFEEEWNIQNIILKFEKTIESLQHKYEVIKNKVARNIIKIFLFGKVSVGKSMLLNAMLADNLFSSGIAHTTSSFVHVKKSDDSNYKIKSKGGLQLFDKKEKFIKELENKSSAIAKIKSQSNETIEVEICIDGNKILKEGIELVDCPGSGNKDNITDNIKKNSEDADIFIFVMNYALTDEDKVFFKYQSNCSSKPDVFIVINSWDDSDNDDEDATQMSKKKIIEECSEFLKKLGITDNNELLNRIYFLSAYEMFQIRVENDDSIVDANDNAKKRQDEFDRFEYNLSKYIENPKENRSRRYKNEIQQINDEISNEIIKFKNNILQEKDDSLELNYKNLIENLQKYKFKIKENCEETRQQLQRKNDILIDQLIRDPNKLNTDWVTSKLEEGNTNIAGILQDAWAKQYKELVNFLKSQDQLRNSNSLHKNKKASLKNMWNPTIIKPSDEPTGEKDSVVAIIERLPILPVPNPIFQIFYIGAQLGFQMVYENMRKQEIEKQNQQIIDQLNSKRLEMISNIEDEVKKLGKDYDQKIDDVIEIFQEKINMFQQYWRRIQSICNELN